MSETPLNQSLKRNERRISFFKKIKHYIISLLRGEETLEESITELIQDHQAHGNQVSYQERELLQNVINYGELRVSDVMVPRSDIKSLPDTANLDDFKELLMKKTHTRIPIYHKGLDDIKGFVNVKDLLPLIYNKNNFASISDTGLIREIFLVPASMKLIDLLVKMKQARIHIAIIVDEYGCTDGLVTFEDLVEEIVGEIEDEFDESQDSSIIKVREDVFVVNAREEIKVVEKECGINFGLKDQEDYDTIGGMVMHILGRVPKKGEVVSFDQEVSLEVLDSNPRKVNKVIIRKGGIVGEYSPQEAK